MTIGEEAKQWYDRNEPEGGFSAALLRCFFFGLVVKRPDFVVLAEQVFTDGKRIVAVAPDCHANCWYVHYFAMREPFSPIDLQNEATYPLPYVAFKKRGKIKVYPWQDLRREFRADPNYFLERTEHGSSTVSSSTNTT